MREAKVFILCGGRGTGKTYYLEKRLPKYCTIVIELYKTNRWEGYKKFFFDDLVNHRVSYKELANSYVVFEDATSYISSNMSNEMRRLIIFSKQLGSDVFIVFHSINVIPPFLWYLWNYLIMWNCAKPKRNASNADYYNEILKKWQICQKSPQYHHEEIESQL